jgi:hypothetical protein
MGFGRDPNAMLTDNNRWKKRRIIMHHLVYRLCYHWGGKLSVAPAIIQIGVLAAMAVGTMFLNPHIFRSGIVGAGSLIFIGLSTFVVIVSRLLNKDWFQVPK